MNKTAVETLGLSREFSTIKAVDQLTIQVTTGSLFGFLGPNGSGKTTTLRLLLGLLKPSNGKARVLGFDTQTQAAKIRQRCGALLEHHGLYERLSAEDNLEYYGRIARLSGQERKARTQELLTHLSLWERRKEIVIDWSRGMKQKLAVARALLHRPALIFLDEPTSGLDPIAAASLREDLVALVQKEGVTVFITTHNLNEAEKICDQVGVIREGRLLALGSPDRLRTQGGSPRVEITGHGFSEQALSLLRQQVEVTHASLHNSHLNIELKRQVEIAPLVTLLVNAGAQIEEIRKGQASLEEVFLTLMEEEK